jgi:tripartite ATP-independent transporter DctM subunit
MIVAFLLGVPIAFALAGAGILGIWLVTGDWNVVIGVLGMAPFDSVANYVLTTIPMFILMAQFSSSAGLANDLYNVASDWLSGLRGGLAIATVFACAIFGAMSGASVAAASVMSRIAMPNMRRFGYSEVLAAGSIGVGSTLDILIPPSVAIVVYGILTDTSIGKLLIAGVVPGIVLAIILALVIWVWVTINPSLAPKIRATSWRYRLKNLFRILPSLLLILMVLVFLYTGIATPTEVGALGAFMAAVIGLALGRLSWSGLMEALKETVQGTVMIFMILIGATIFSQFMTMSQVPQKIIAIITEMNLNRWIVMIFIIVAYFVISMFMDEIPLMVITLQLTFPLIVSLKFDPIWYGVLTCLLIAMGLVFPPVGMIAFIVSATTGVDLVKVYKGTSVLIIAIFLTTILIMLFPQIVLWLPLKMH